MKTTTAWRAAKVSLGVLLLIVGIPSLSPQIRAVDMIAPCTAGEAPAGPKQRIVVRLAVEGYADDIHETGFASLKELMTNFVEAGGTIYVCSPCFKKRGLDENKLVKGAKIVGGAKLVEFLASGAPCVSY